MEEFKKTVDFLLKSSTNVPTIDIDVKLAALNEFLRIINPQTSANFSECLQSVLHSINENVNTSDCGTTCVFLILNYILSNNYYENLTHQIFMEIILQLSNEYFNNLYSIQYKHVNQLIVKNLNDGRFESKDLALKTVEKLVQLETDPKCLRKYLNENLLITKLIPFLFSDAKELRQTMINIIMSMTTPTVSFTTVTTIHIFPLKSGLLDDSLKYVLKIERLLRANDAHWHQVWCCVVRLLGLELHKGGPLYVNALLEVLEEAFKSSMNSTRISAFQCWQELILNFAVNIEELCTKKRMKLLLIPLKASNCKAELVALEKFKTWWLLLNKMSQRLHDFIEEALIPFLNFCFSTLIPNSTNHTSSLHKKEDNSYLGRRFPAILPHIIDALLQIIGHKTKNCSCIERNPVEFVNIRRDALAKISKTIIKSVKEATLLISKSDSKQTMQIIECLWYSLLQIIRKDETKGIHEEFISHVIEIIDKLLARNASDIAAIILEQTILEKAWLFLSLDHEIQYVQNMADKKKLIFSIKKPLALYNFINILHGAGGDQAEEMINNLLFNVTFLITIPEIEVYQFFIQLSTIITKLPKLVQEFLRTPIEYLIRSPDFNLRQWCGLFEKFLNENHDYPAETVVEFCMYLETLQSNAVLVGSILNICIPKLKVMSVPNICIERILKLLSRLVVEKPECFVFNSLNKLLKLFYMNYGAISIIFKSLPLFLSYHKNQNYDDFFYVMSTIGDIISKVSTDQFLLTLILTSLRNFEISENDVEVSNQIQALIKKCKQKLKPDSKSDKKLEQNNRSAKMVAMSTTEAIDSTPLSIDSSPIRVREPKSINESAPLIATPATIILGHNIETMTPTVKRTSFLARLPTGPPPPPTDFVVINSNWKFDPQNMSEKQKEKLKSRGKDLPAMYQDLSQSNSQDLFNNIRNEFIPDENLKENLTENLTFKNIEEVPKTVEPVDKKRTKRRTITRVQRHSVDVIAMTATSSSENISENNTTSKLIEAVSENAEEKLRKAKRELKKLHIDCKTSLTVMGAAERKTLRSRELSSSVVSTEPPVTRKRRKSTKSGLNQSEIVTTQPEESEEVIESSQDSPVPSKITAKGINNRSMKSQPTLVEKKVDNSLENRLEDDNLGGETVAENVQTNLVVECEKTIKDTDQKIVETNGTKSKDVLGEKEPDAEVAKISGESVEILEVCEKNPSENNKKTKRKTLNAAVSSSENPPPPPPSIPELIVNLENFVEVSQVNKLHSIIENNYNVKQDVAKVDLKEKQIASNTIEENPPPNIDSDSIPTTAEAVLLAEKLDTEKVSESEIYDKDTESLTDDFTENNASFIEYKSADNSVIATNMVSSPTHTRNDDQQSEDIEKTKEFLNSTLNISPIKQTETTTTTITTSTTVTPILNKSPEMIFSDDVEKSQPIITSSESLIEFGGHHHHHRGSPSIRRRLQRARGRSAQLLELLPNTVADGIDKQLSHREMMMEGMFDLPPNGPECVDKSQFKDLLTFEKELPSPLAKPSSSIMKGGSNKRKQPFDLEGGAGDSDSPKSKRKRVSFHDPPVSCEKQYVPDIQRNSKLRLTSKIKKSQKSLLDLFKSPIFPQHMSAGVGASEIMDNSHGTYISKVGFGIGSTTAAATTNSGITLQLGVNKPFEFGLTEKDLGELSKDDYLIEPPTESQGSVDVVSTDTLNNVSPFYPELVTCTESIDTIVMDLTSPLWMTSLKRVFDERNIRTIGQFAALTELELNRLPLREHKINNSRMALTKYLNSRPDKSPTEEKKLPEDIMPVKRGGTKRKRRFSLSLLEKERDEMTMDMKIAQLESIFGNCKDPNDMSTLLNTIISIIGTENTEILVNALGDNVSVRHLAKRHVNQDNFIQDVLKYVGLNKSIESCIKYAVSIVGSDSTYEKCVTNLKTISGIDFTTTMEEDNTGSVRSVVDGDQRSILNTTEMCMKQIHSTADTLCEKLTTLIQSAAASPNGSSSSNQTVKDGGGSAADIVTTTVKSNNICDVDSFENIKDALKKLPREQFFDLMKDCFFDK